MDLDSIRSKEEYDILGLKKLFFKLQFKTLIDRLPKNEEDKDETPFDEYDVIEEIEGLKALKNNIKGSKENKPLYMSFDIIGQELYSNIAIESIYIDFEEKDFVIKLSNLLEKDRENTILILKEFMEDNNIKKICYDAKNAYTSFRKIGITLEGIIFDVKIANYITDSSKGQQRLQELINEYLGREVKGEGEALKAHENRLMVELYEVLKAKIEEFNMESL